MGKIVKSDISAKKARRPADGREAGPFGLALPAEQGNHDGAMTQEVAQRR